MGFTTAYTSVTWTSGDVITEAKLDAMVANDQAYDSHSAQGLELTEMSTPSTPAANKVRIYAKDKDGVSTLYYLQDDGTEVEVGGGGASFWTPFSGAYATATTIVVATDLTGIFKKGVVIKWLSSGDALKVGKVVSSSYSSPNTTIVVVGSAVQADDKNFYYGADIVQETFIIAGNQAPGTNISKGFSFAFPHYKISVDARVTTAGTTNPTVYDVNANGTTIITTKPSIATTETTDLNNVCDSPATEMDADTIYTVDIDSASTTQAIDGYIKLFVIPSWWINRT